MPLDARPDPCAAFGWRGDEAPDYVAAFAWRQRQLITLHENPVLRTAAIEYYRDKPIEFIEHWCITYDPRNAGTDTPTTMPFLMFPRQRALVQFLVACIGGEQDGLIEKTRDMGATWIAGAFSVWLWRYRDGAAVGWGSLKAADVDELGVASSVFEKMRMIVRKLPRFMWPKGFDPATHMPHMKIMNPETGAVIQGASGDNIGRGGRSLIYFKDESAHYERPEKIEAALGDNTRVQIDISSVNGLGNVFHRRRESGTDWTGGAVVKGTNVFVMDWRDHPHKTQQWYDDREKKARDAGMLHVHRQEIDRNYAASVAGVLIPHEWVQSAIDAHIKLDFGDEGMWSAALDVADNDSPSGDRNAFGGRKGVVLKYAEEWGERDVGATARRAIAGCSEWGDLDLQYDCIGVGSGVKSEWNRLSEDPEVATPTGLNLIPWDAGARPLDPEGHVIEDDKNSPLNKDFYENLKAQGGWCLRLRFERTHRAVTEGVKYDPADLISIDSSLPLMQTIVKELSQPTTKKSGRLKLMINKTPEGTRSPNLYDMIMMLYHPCEGGPLPYGQWI